MTLNAFHYAGPGGCFQQKHHMSGNCHTLDNETNPWAMKMSFAVDQEILTIFFRPCLGLVVQFQSWLQQRRQNFPSVAHLIGRSCQDHHFIYDLQAAWQRAAATRLLFVPARQQDPEASCHAATLPTMFHISYAAHVWLVLETNSKAVDAGQIDDLPMPDSFQGSSSL